MGSEEKIHPNTRRSGIPGVVFFYNTQYLWLHDFTCSLLGYNKTRNTGHV